MALCKQIKRKLAERRTRALIFKPGLTPVSAAQSVSDDIIIVTNKTWFTKSRCQHSGWGGINVFVVCEGSGVTYACVFVLCAVISDDGWL